VRSSTNCSMVSRHPSFRLSAGYQVSSASVYPSQLTRKYLWPSSYFISFKDRTGNIVRPWRLFFRFTWLVFLFLVRFWFISIVLLKGLVWHPLSLWLFLFMLLFTIIFNLNLHWFWIFRFESLDILCQFFISLYQ